MVRASKDQVTTADAGLSEAEASSHHFPLFPPARGVDGRDRAGSAPRRCEPGRVDCSQRRGGPVSAHLQGSRVVLHLRQPFSDLAVGHGAAQGVVGGLQQLQLVLVLSQGLRVAAWVGGTGFRPTGQWARGSKANGVAAGRYSGSPCPRSHAPTAPTPPHAPWLARSSPSWWQTEASSRSRPLLWALALALLSSAERETRPER